MFVLMPAPNGSRLLLNLELTFAFSEDAAGLALAISVGGAQLPLGVKFNTIAEDLGGEQDGNTTEGPR